RADLWALGIVAYRLLSKRFPFRGDTSEEVLAAILERPFTPLRSIGVDVPEEVDLVIARCLARAREERFSDAGQLAAAFAPFASPTWRPYGRLVCEISSGTGGPLPSPLGVERPRAPAIVDDPHTATVPPPEATSDPHLQPPTAVTVLAET